MEHEAEKTLKEVLQKYSFEDIVKGFFVINLWLPNITSHTKSQFIYAVLESVHDKLQLNNQVHTYEDFKGFVEALLPLVPSFSMMEDFFPENDWGEIRYFVNDKIYKIFYGGDLENPYESIYAFEVVHKGFEDFYKKKLGRSPLEELELCLSVQDKIITGINRDSQDFSETELGAFKLPSETFWTECYDFLDSFDPDSLYGKKFVDEYSKNMDTAEVATIPGLDDFEQAVHDGTNFPYLFYRKNGKVFPVLPRKSFAVVFDKWGKIFSESYVQIMSEVPHYETKMGLELFGFMCQRTGKNEVFAFVSALKEDMKPHKTVFTSAFVSKNRIVLIHVIPPPTPDVTQQQTLDALVPELKEVQDLLSKAPTRLALLAEKQIAQFGASKDYPEALEPLIITVVPHITTDFGILGHPRDLVGETIGLDQFLAIFDEMEDLDEFADFFEHIQSTRDDGMPSFSTLLDRFGSFRDSHSVLIEGASNPDMIVLDPHWGSSFRYRSLSDFWKAFPEENFFGNPRSWTINKKLLEVATVMLKSKKFFGYTYCLTLGQAHLFINSPVDSQSYEQGQIADSLMHSLEDSFKQYENMLKSLPFANNHEKIHFLFFPKSLVKAGSKFDHIKHLLPTDDSLWAMDTTRLKSRDYGIRIVFDDTKVVEALKGAKNRSLQISLLQSVLSEINAVFGGDNGTVAEKLESEKTQKNRFRMFSYQKKVSFPELAKPHVVAETRELKLADKKLAEIGKENGVIPGKYAEKEAKENLDKLKYGLLKYLDERIAVLNLKKALPILLSNIDSLTNTHERDQAQVQDSVDQEVDYQREEFSGKKNQAYIHNQKNYRYLIEKLVQLQPTGNKELTDTELAELFALVDRMLLLYAVSDFLYYGIHPAKIEIMDDYLVNVNYGNDIEAMIKAGAEEQAKIRLGMIGNPEDNISVPNEVQKYVEEIDQAFKTDLGFSLRDMMDVHRILMFWPVHKGDLPESTYYNATADEIVKICVEKMEGVDPVTLPKILDFMTLDPDKILLIEGREEVQADIPVWEHRKKTMRYSIRPLIKAEGHYYWGPYSVERSARLWGGIAGNSNLPSDISAETIVTVLEKGRQSIADAMAVKVAEIVRRFTTEVETDVYPHRHRLISTNIIGDVDVFAFIRDKNIILNIESKTIDQVYCNKDLKTLAETIFGKNRSDGSFKKGYLQRVIEREDFLKDKGKELAEKFWGTLPDKPKVISIFVTQTSYWWTKYPLIKSDVHFVELALLEDLLKNLLA